MYKRVSAYAQVKEGYSLEVQEIELDKLAELNGWHIEKVFHDDGKTARDLNRKEIQRFLDYCDEHHERIDIALFQDSSRLCRKVEDHLAVKAFLKRKNINVLYLDGVTLDDSPESDFIDVVIAAINELESKRTGKKTKRVMTVMAEMGLKPGQAPLGYINSFQKGIPMKIDIEREHFFREMFRLWNTGNYSLQQISDVLFEQGLRSINGKKVQKSAIEGYLKNILYAGGLEYDGAVYEEAQHKGIISMAEFRRAQEVFKLRNKGADRTRKHITLLAGVAHCFRCGSLMYGEYHPKANYYTCKVCKKTNANMEDVNACIEEFFTGTRFLDEGLEALRDELLTIKRKQVDYIPSQRTALTNRKSALEVKMSGLEDKLLYGDENVDKERIKKKYDPLKLELKRVEQELHNLDKPSNNLKDSEIEKVIEGMKRIKEIYVHFKPMQKKQFLKFFISKVYVDAEANKIVQYELIPEFEDLINRDLVRISSNWLYIAEDVRNVVKHEKTAVGQRV